MKRLLLLLVLNLGLLTCWSANVTKDPSHLMFGKVSFEGCMRAGLVQMVHVQVANTGTEDYEGVWDAFDMKNGSDVTILLQFTKSRTVEVPAGKIVTLDIKFLFDKPGDYQIAMKPHLKLYDTTLFTFAFTLTPYEQPRMKGSIEVDMMEQTAEGNYLYGDFSKFRISGRVTITNEEDFTVWDDASFYVGAANFYVAISWFGKQDLAGAPPLSPNFYHLKKHYLSARETLTEDFCFEFEAAPEEGKQYGIGLYGLYSLASVKYTPRQGTFTYWTADGHVKLMPSRRIKFTVPAEAVAVDLRGNYGMPGTYTINASAANPNCLFYLNKLDYVPQGLNDSSLIIREYAINDFVVDSHYDYYCPMPFEAKTALFTYTPISERWGEPQPNMTSAMSGALVLPFNAQQAMLTDVNEILKFDGNPNAIYRYKGNNGNQLRFSPVSEWPLKAYEPYLLKVLPSPVTFYSEKVTIPATRPVVVMGTDFDFVGATTQQATPDGYYRWSCDNRYFYQSDTEDLVRPFTSLMKRKEGTATSGAGYDVLYVDGWEYEPLTAVKPVYDRVASDEAFTLSGQRADVRSLKPGIYIIGTRKVVVK